MTLTPDIAPTVHVDVPLNLPTEDGGTFRVLQPIGAHRTQTEGLVVFPALVDLYEFDESRWNVTHVGTGLRIPVDFDSEEKATAYANACGPLADWAQDRPELPVETRVKLLQLALEHGCQPDKRVDTALARHAAKTDGGGE